MAVNDDRDSQSRVCVHHCWWTMFTQRAAIHVLYGVFQVNHDTREIQWFVSIWITTSTIAMRCHPLLSQCPSYDFLPFSMSTGQEALQLGLAQVRQAVGLDTAQYHAEALQLYQSALQNFKLVVQGEQWPSNAVAETCSTGCAGGYKKTSHWEDANVFQESTRVDAVIGESETQYGATIGHF